MWLHVPFVGRNQVGRGGQPRQTTSPPPSPPPLPPTHPRPPPAPHPTPSTHSLTPLVASPPGTNGACGGWELAFPFDGERAAVTAPCRRSCPPFCCPGLLLNKSLARFPRHVVTKMPAYASLTQYTALGLPVRETLREAFFRWAKNIAGGLGEARRVTQQVRGGAETCSTRL